MQSIRIVIENKEMILEIHEAKLTKLRGQIPQWIQDKILEFKDSKETYIQIYFVD